MTSWAVVPPAARAWTARRRRWSRTLLRVIVHSQPRNESPGRSRRNSAMRRATAVNTSWLTSAPSASRYTGAAAPLVAGFPVQPGQALPRAGLAGPEPCQEARPEGSVRVARRWPGVGNNIRVVHGLRRLERIGEGGGEEMTSRHRGLMLASASPRGQG